MVSRKSSRAKTSAELREQLEAAKKKLELLEQRAYAEELHELILATNIRADFAKIQSKVTDIKPVTILAAIGHAVGIRRLKIEQAPTTPRKPADPNKPRKTRASKAKKA